MGHYSYTSKVSFRWEENNTSYYDDSVTYEVWAGYGRKWKRKVGTIVKTDGDYDDPDYWEVSGDYGTLVDRGRGGYADDGKFPTLKAAKEAVLYCLDGGMVDINNSTDEDYLRRITDRKLTTIYPGD
jgi:hypothetical protein